MEEFIPPCLKKKGEALGEAKQEDLEHETVALKATKLFSFLNSKTSNQIQKGPCISSNSISLLYTTACSDFESRPDDGCMMM